MKKQAGFILLAMVSLFLLFSCRMDSPSENVRVEGIRFADSTRTISVGDIVTIGLTIAPSGAASGAGAVTYTSSNSGVVEIQQGSSNSGVIIQGINRGTAVVTARMGNHTDYITVTVGGAGESLIPHIITPVPGNVMEVPVNSTRSITVSLAGGTPGDNSNFIWSSTNPQIIDFTAVNNVGIFSTINPGQAVITVRHPRAQFGVDILVFSLGAGDAPVFITGETNVITMNMDTTQAQFSVALSGGTQEDHIQFNFDVTNGRDVVDLSWNHNVATLIPQMPGTALIEVHHRLAEHPFRVQVIVNDSMEHRFININRSLILMNDTDSTHVTASFEGDAPNHVHERYIFTLSEHGIVNVTQAQDVFFINAIPGTGGRVILTINNEYADFPREVLIIVNNTRETVIHNERYISTSQNVITMEVGEQDALLRMLLVGGNSADRNNFSWVVDNASVVGVRPAHGQVIELDRSPIRAVVNNVPIDRLETYAFIEARRTGTARITLQHPRSRNDTTVMVRVYPRGTFAATPAVLRGQPYYRVERGRSIEIGLIVESGSRDVGNVTWTVEDGTIASVVGSGLNAIINGISSGVTNVTVSGGNLRHQFSAVIVVADYDFMNEMRFMYVLNPFITMTTGQSVTTNVLSVNMTQEEVRALNITNSNPNAVAVNKDPSSGLIVLQGLQRGEAEVFIRGNNVNELRLTVSVIDPALTPETPFYLSSAHSILGMTRTTREISVSLAGAGQNDIRGISWRSDNENVVQVSGSGGSALLTGRNIGQAVVEGKPSA